MEQRSFFQKYDVSLVIGALLAIGFTVTCITVGSWEAVRSFAVEALILAAMFWVARQYLPWEDAERERLKTPRFELAAGIVSYLLILGGLLASFNQANAWPWLAAGLLIPITIMLVHRYGADSWGLRFSRDRDWIVLAVISLLVVGLSRIFDILLPQGELVGPRDAQLLQIPLGSFLNFLLSALLVEFFFRVYLQPRLAAYISGRWALFLQAVLYSLAFLPLYILDRGYPLPYALATTLVLTNGVMAGYFWRKTGSLPLLVLLHMLAFFRYGL
jgi:membrane protease YdiL (CAAX protease family)